uniref:Uncharacterized protein n=1 Tax=Coccidioides posadasii RMSCC 3488 TaxID=454284 RepID=A0A0J6F343_COCPO|nr:hypothetical protein CPAG_00019 [Coccidioides posadasii RMSCC 3488]
MKEISSGGNCFIIEVDWHGHTSIVNDTTKMRVSCLSHLDQDMKKISPSRNCFIIEVDSHDYTSIVNSATKMRVSCLSHLDQDMKKISSDGNCFVIKVNWHGHASIVNDGGNLLWCKLFGLVFEFKIMDLLFLLMILKKKCFMSA